MEKYTKHEAMALDESKHPRDDDGKFTDKASGEKSLRDYQMKYGLEDGRLKYYRDRMEDAGIDLSNRSESDNITKEDYHKIRSLVNDKISTYRAHLERKGKIKTTIFTFEYIYIVELNNDDDYSFEILDKELND